MSEDFVRTLYHPLQPAENNSGRSKLFYSEYLPAPHLQSYIHCFWELKTIEHFTGTCVYHVVADGCIDLIINCQSFEGITMVGVAGQAFDVPVQSPCAYFGIRFLPAGIHHFMNFPVSQLQNQMLEISYVNSAWRDWSAQVFEKNNSHDRVGCTNTFLTGLLGRVNANIHPAFLQALYHILLSGGDLPIQKKAAAWISPRQLQRLFNEHIGCTPKLFSRIVRFQKILHHYTGPKPKKDNFIFYHHGYSDQAHFIKEFKQLYGNTPGALGKE